METNADVESEYRRDLNKPDERHVFEVQPLEPIQGRLVPAQISRDSVLAEIGGLPFLAQLADEATN